MTHKPPFRNLRSYVRRPVSWRAQVRPEGRPPMACTVKDVSEQGALLEFSGRAPAIDRFRLTIAANGFDGLCQVMHRKVRTVGVQFRAVD